VVSGASDETDVMAENEDPQREAAAPDLKSSGGVVYADGVQRLLCARGGHDHRKCMCEGTFE